MFRRKRTLYALLAIAIIAAILVAARSYFLQRFQNTLLDEIQALNESDINIHYDTIYLDWKRNVLTVEKLVIEKDAYDTTCIYPEFISCQKVQVEGVGLLSLLFQSELSIDELRLFRPHWVMHDKSSFLKSDSAQGKKSRDFEMYIKRIRVDELELEMTDSTTCKLARRINTNAAIGELEMSLKGTESPEISFSTASVTEARIDLPKSFYTFTVKAAQLNMGEHVFTADTIRIIPSFSKLQFGREAGTDLDRIEGVIPFIKASNLNIQYQDTTIIDVNKINAQIFLKIFHDKRLPHPNRVVALPLEKISQLKFGLTIDEFNIIKSYVEYEEIAPQADEAGKVFFDNIEGEIRDITSDMSNEKGKTTFIAKADFMGQGNLSVKTVLPYDRRKRGTVKGGITGLSFEKLNGMIEPAANVRFESGKLNELNFAFTFNDRYSNGNVSINYEDLKVIALRTDEEIEKAGKKKRNRNKSDEELRKDNLKTFIVNAFVLKKNLDEKVPVEKRLGTIAFTRDRSRSVFNFWWKSIFTGVKSAFNLDKTEATVERLKGLKKK